MLNHFDFYTTMNRFGRQAKDLGSWAPPSQVVAAVRCCQVCQRLLESSADGDYCSCRVIAGVVAVADGFVGTCWRPKQRPRPRGRYSSGDVDSSELARSRLVAEIGWELESSTRNCCRTSCGEAFDEQQQHAVNLGSVTCSGDSELSH